MLYYSLKALKFSIVLFIFSIVACTSPENASPNSPLGTGVRKNGGTSESVVGAYSYKCEKGESTIQRNTRSILTRCSVSGLIAGDSLEFSNPRSISEEVKVEDVTNSNTPKNAKDYLVSYAEDLLSNEIHSVEFPVTVISSKNESTSFSETVTYPTARFSFNAETYQEGEQPRDLPSLLDFLNSMLRGSGVTVPVIHNNKLVFSNGFFYSGIITGIQTVALAFTPVSDRKPLGILNFSKISVRIIENVLLIGNECSSPLISIPVQEGQEYHLVIILDRTHSQIRYSLNGADLQKVTYIPDNATSHSSSTFILGGVMSCAAHANGSSALQTPGYFYKGSIRSFHAFDTISPSQAKLLYQVSSGNSGHEDKKNSGNEIKK